MVDIAGPKEEEIIVGPGFTVGNAFEGHFDDPIVEEFESLAALECVVRGGGLVEFGCVGIDEAEFHGGMARLEEGVSWLGGAIDDVLEVQPGVRGHEEVARLGGVLERGQTAVAGAVTGEDGVIDRAIIDNDGFDVAALEDDVWFFRDSEANLGIGKGGDGWGFGGLGAQGQECEEDESRFEAHG